MTGLLKNDTAITQINQSNDSAATPTCDIAASMQSEATPNNAISCGDEDGSDLLNCDSAMRLIQLENSPDDLLATLGGRNIYLLLIWLSSAICWGLAAMPMMASTFFMDIPCNLPSSAENRTEVCNSNVLSNCDHLNGTLTEEFQLPIPRDDEFFSIPQMSTATYLLGIILGSIALPRLSDHIGRHPILCFSLIMSGVVGCLSAIVPFVQMFVALRFLQGVCFPGVGITNWVLAYESIPPILRSYTTMMFGLWWVVGYCAIGPLAFFLPNWRWLAFAASIPSIIFGIFYLHFLPESFHWLASNGDERRIRTWLKRANSFARIFGTKQTKHVLIRRFCITNRRRSHPGQHVNFSAGNQNSNRQKETTENMETVEQTVTMNGSGSNAMVDIHLDGGIEEPANKIQLAGKLTSSSTSYELKKEDERCVGWFRFKSRYLVWVYTAIFAYLWTCNTFIYYGLSLFSTKLVGDIYWNYVWVGVVEIPSYIVSPYLLNKLGRRVFVSLAHFLASAAYTVIVFNELIPQWMSQTSCPLEWVTLTMWLIGKFAISCSFTCLFVFASEVFPTVSRNSNIGICAACSRVGAVSVPLVKQMSREWQLGLYGFSALLGGVLTLLLPETLNKTLPASSAEVPKSSKFKSADEKPHL